MVREVRIKKKTLSFREPFAIAYEKVEKTSVLLITLKDEEGRIGLGSAAPDEMVTGENIDELKELLGNLLCPEFFSRPASDLEWYEEKIQEVFAGYPSAQAAVETALMHLDALQRNRSPQANFGLCRKSCDLVVTLGIKPLTETIDEVRGRLAEGFKTIKLKVGLDPRGDVEKIQEVRALMMKDNRLIIDANQGYSYQDAKQVLRAIRMLDIAGMEQPIVASHKEEFRKLRAMELVPLIADEVAKTKEEAMQLIKQDYVDGINVKMMKYGGPSACREIIEYALEQSKLVMLGCMYESNVSITAAAYLALAYPIDFVDLDSGHFDFDDDSTVGGAVVKNGVLRIVGIPKLKEEVSALSSV